MKLTFLGAAHEVTGSCSLLEACGKRILIDCGMEQGADIYENCDIPVSPEEIDIICLTHAHIDHTGKVPFLVAHGFGGAIYATDATRKLCDIMLMDSGHIQEAEAEWRNRKAKRKGEEEYVPLYTTKDVEKTMPLFKPCNYDSEVKIADGITIRFTDDGHLLGSSNILFTITEEGETRTLLFSGDIGNHNKPLIEDPKRAPQADYVVIESTYGDRTHPASPDYVGQLAAILDRTFSRGGTVVIPAFAVGRTQEMLYYIRQIKEKNLVSTGSDFPVYVDSPLAAEATSIYSREVDGYYDEEARKLIEKGINPIAFEDLRLAVSTDESRALNMNLEPKVIISASGMCEAGRIRHHLKHNLWKPECTVVFVGYQSPGTVGGKLLEGVDSVKLFGEDVAVKAEIAQVEGCSSHADKNMLLNWLKSVIKEEGTRVFVNHGEDAVTVSFSELVSSEFGVEASAPFSGEVYDLVTGECIERAPVVPVVKKAATPHPDLEKVPEGSNQGSRRGNKYYKKVAHAEEEKSVGYKRTEHTQKVESLYGALQSAGRRLIDLIERMQGYSNHEVQELTDEIEKLIEKHQ
ncbi:MAG: MBL fold metallo-hydrolase [Clostridiales bacterium]|nr:MBL fold metallo-hydrolase [Candidatus Crickella caballi]